MKKIIALKLYGSFAMAHFTYKYIFAVKLMPSYHKYSIRRISNISAYYMKFDLALHNNRDRYRLCVHVAPTCTHGLWQASVLSGMHTCLQTFLLLKYTLLLGALCC